MDGKESECPIVVLKRGNGPPGPRGAKGVPRCGPEVGTTPRTPCLTSVSPQGDGSCEGQRHNVTSRMPLTGTSGSARHNASFVTKPRSHRSTPCSSMGPSDNQRITFSRDDSGSTVLLRFEARRSFLNRCRSRPSAHTIHSPRGGICRARTQLRSAHSRSLSADI